MNNIIEKPLTNYKYTYPNKYFKGYINPIEKKFISGLINVNSKFRQNYLNTQSTNFQLNLPIIIKNILSIKLIDIYIPDTYYTINSIYYNNFFLIKIEHENDVKKIIIPDGNYTPNEIVSFLNKTMLALGNFFKYIYFAINQKKDNTTGELIVGIKESTPFAFTFTLDFYRDLLENNNIDNIPLQHRFGWLLGFRYDNYRHSSIYVSEGVINLDKPKCFFLAIDYYNYNNNYSFITGFNNSASNNILAKIILCNHKHKEKPNIINTPQKFFGPINLEKMFISLIDEYGRIVNLNNSDFSFIISFDKDFSI